MKRRHSMSFGAEMQPGGVRFRLWAPDARTVELMLDGADPRPLEKGFGGWFERVEPEARAGDRYRFRIDGELLVPDPASRAQLEGVHGASEVVDPNLFPWTDGAWRGRPWEEVVLYELHVGSFSPEGSFAGVEAHLDELAELGVTAIELMPVADFSGTRGWGYDGVLLFAPHGAYGRPDDLKRLVQAAHARGLMVFLDVVYNHFGPDGNYLHAYAKPFFTDRHHTPWGAANNFDGAHAQTVRDFFIHNALYWLKEYHLDGLRLDAVNVIQDDSRRHFLTELAERVRGAFPHRQIHLVLENDDNAARHLGPRLYDGQWNDDLHHAVHALLTGEGGGYYRDYQGEPLTWLGRALAEGFAYQGEASAYRGGRPRGEPSRHLPATRFVSFLQNHDQVGNRALGERLTRLVSPQAIEAGLAVLLLAPQIPLLFMGEEWGAEQPFLFFCDFDDERLAKAVRRGRKRDYAEFMPHLPKHLPDPNAEASFQASVLDRSQARPGRRALIQRLLGLRALHIVPRLKGLSAEAGVESGGASMLKVWWRLIDGATLCLWANLGETPASGRPEGEIIYSNHEVRDGVLPPWAITWTLSRGTETT